MKKKTLLRQFLQSIKNCLSYSLPPIKYVVFSYNGTDYMVQWRSIFGKIFEFKLSKKEGKSLHCDIYGEKAITIKKTSSNHIKEMLKELVFDTVYILDKRA